MGMKKELRVYLIDLWDMNCNFNYIPDTIDEFPDEEFKNYAMSFSLKEFQKKWNNDELPTDSFIRFIEDEVN
jgi:hypothetical protein